MKELLNLLETRERRILVFLCVFLVAFLIFHQGIALKQKQAYCQSVETLPNKQKEVENLKGTNDEIKMEWLQWDEARRDIADIEKRYFYREDENMNQMRIDLREILREARTQVVSDMIFNWGEWEGEDLKRVSAQFSIAGSYAAMKRFIHQVEIHPKFLMIEKIDFRDVDTQTGQVELQIELAGYYEN